METLTVKSISVSKGTSEKGDWVNTQITPTEGRKWTGFIDSLASLKEGDVINITDYKEGTGNKFNKILKYEKVSSGSPATSSADERTGMTPELWAEKDRLERWSRECNTCFMGIMELAKQPPSDEKYKPVFEQALAWAEAHFKPLTQAEPSQKATAPTEKKAAPSTPAEGEDWPPLKDLGQLYTRAAGYGISPRDVVESVGVGKGEDIIDFDKAWAAMASSTKFASTIKAAAEAS